MKNFFLLFSIILFFYANSQSLTKKLQDKTWFVTGDLLKPTGNILLSKKKPAVKYSEVKFFPDNKLHLDLYGKNEFNFVCSYELKKDMIRIHYTVNHPKAGKKQEEIMHYYKIKESPNKKDLELIQVTAGEFK
jgi:hypothetical protein